MPLDRDETTRLMRALCNLRSVDLQGQGFSGMVVSQKTVIELVADYSELDLSVTELGSGAFSVTEVVKRGVKDVGPTVEHMVVGCSRASNCAVLLATYHRWFELMPWPDDQYHFRTKDEPGAPSPFTDYERVRT